MKRGSVVLDEDGIEHPDTTPVEIPTRLKLPQRQVDRIREMIRRELSTHAAATSGAETFQESDDFELPDVDWVSPYEEIFEPIDKSPVKESNDVERGKSTAPLKEKDDDSSSGGKGKKPSSDGDEQAGTVDAVRGGGQSASGGSS